MAKMMMMKLNKYKWYYNDDYDDNTIDIGDGFKH